MGRLFKRYRLFSRLSKACGCTGLREEKRISNNVFGLLSYPMKSLGIISSKFPQCVTLTPWYSICEQLCANNMILFPPPLPSSLWDFPGWAEPFHPNSKQDQVSSLVTSCPPHPLQNLHLRIYEMSKTDPDLFVVCRSWKEPERKSTIPKPQEFQKVYFNQRNLFRGTSSQYM